MRLRGYLVALGLTALVVAPIFRDPPRDSFPLSNYPMFATRPENPWVFVALGADDRGVEHRLSPWLATGSREVMQAAETVRIAVFESASAQMALCEEIARRVASEPSREALRQIRIVGLSYDPIRYFEEDGVEPVNRLDYQTCPVVRGGKR